MPRAGPGVGPRVNNEIRATSARSRACPRSAAASGGRACDGQFPVQLRERGLGQRITAGSAPPVGAAQRSRPPSDGYNRYFRSAISTVMPSGSLRISCD